MDEVLDLKREISDLKNQLADAIYEREKDIVDAYIERDQFRARNEYLEDKIHDIKIQLSGI